MAVVGLMLLLHDDLDLLSIYDFVGDLAVVSASFADVGKNDTTDVLLMCISS